MEYQHAIDKFLEESGIAEKEREESRKVSEALAKARQAVQDRHNRNTKEQIMETKTPDTSTASATVPAVKPTPKPAAKPKAAAKPAKKAAPKKAAPKAKAKPAKKVKTHSGGMGRKVKYTKELIMELVKQAKSSGKSLKAVVAGRKALKYVPLLVAAKKLHGLDLWKLMNGTTFHKNGKRA